MLTKLQSSSSLSHSKLKERARKGIPDSIRGSAWPILSGSKI